MGLVAVIAIVLFLDTYPRRIGRAYGTFPLRVRLEIPPGRSIVAVSAGVDFDAEQIREMIYSPENLTYIISVRDVDWAADQSFEVEVPWYSRISLLSGRRLGHFQRNALVLRLDYADDTEQWLVREIPIRRESQTLTVTVP